MPWQCLGSFLPKAACNLELLKSFDGICKLGAIDRKLHASKTPTAL